MVVVISVGDAFSLWVGSSLALGLSDILFGALIGISVASFSFWIWFHSSYFERVREAEQEEAQAVRESMRQIQQATQLNDQELDQWLAYVSDRYARVGTLRVSMQRTVDDFRHGGQFGLIGILAQVVSIFYETSAPSDSSFASILAWLCLALSTFLMMNAIWSGNRLMKVLSA